MKLPSKDIQNDIDNAAMDFLNGNSNSLTYLVVMFSAAVITTHEILAAKECVNIEALQNLAQEFGIETSLVLGLQERGITAKRDSEGRLIYKGLRRKT